MMSWPGFGLVMRKQFYVNTLADLVVLKLRGANSWEGTPDPEKSRN